MYAVGFMTQKLATQITASLQAPLLKTSQKISFAHFAALVRTIFLKNNSRNNPKSNRASLQACAIVYLSDILSDKTVSLTQNAM